MIYLRTAYGEIMTADDELATPMIDREAVTRVLQAHPVRVGVLFGSHVRGTETAESDVDVAVEFAESLSRTERREARLGLIVDLMETLGVNDVDVTDLDDVRPAVGASALRTGAVLVDEEGRVDRLLDAFEAETTDRSHEERMRQFDDLLARLEEAV
jgi:predicted nucleotidyltransferase